MDRPPAGPPMTSPSSVCIPMEGSLRPIPSNCRHRRPLTQASSQRSVGDGRPRQEAQQLWPPPLSSRAATPLGDVFEDTLARLRAAHEGALQQLRAEMMDVRHRQEDAQSLRHSAGAEDKEEHHIKSLEKADGDSAPEKPPEIDDAAAVPPVGLSQDVSPQHPTSSLEAHVVSAHTGLHKLAFSSVGTKALHGQETRCGWLERFARSPYFDAFFAWLIFANTVVMAVEAQWSGLMTGSAVKFNDYTSPQWPNAMDTFDVLELVFGFIFAMELLIKSTCLRMDFLKDTWNILDTIIVIAWAITSVGSDNMLYLHPGLLRLMRLVRLLRLVRLVRSMQGFDSLIIMTTAMRGSMSILFWTVVVLTLVLMMCALLLQALAESYMAGPAEEERRMVVFMYYGTFSRSLLTMFEITMGNWMPPCRALVENISEWYMIFFLVHKLVIGFSVLNVISGVFLQETFKVASTDDHLMVLHRDRAIRIHTNKIRRLFAHLDDNGDGTVTLEEFQAVADDVAVRRWLSAMELDVRDVGSVFRLLDETNEGRLSAESLVQGVSRIKGQARSIDLCTLLAEDRENWKALAGDMHTLTENVRVQEVPQR